MGLPHGMVLGRAGSNYTKLFQLHDIFYFNYNYSHNFPNQLQLHCYNYIMRNQIYSAFVDYVFLRVLLNFNILYTVDNKYNDNVCTFC